MDGKSEHAPVVDTTSAIRKPPGSSSSRPSRRGCGRTKTARRAGRWSSTTPSVALRRFTRLPPPPAWPSKFCTNRSSRTPSFGPSRPITPTSFPCTPTRTCWTPTAMLRHLAPTCLGPSRTSFRPRTVTVFHRPPLSSSARSSNSPALVAGSAHCMGGVSVFRSCSMTSRVFPLATSTRTPARNLTGC